MEESDLKEKGEETKNGKICKWLKEAYEDMYVMYHRRWNFFVLKKNTWIRDLGALCHITKDETGL